MTVFEYLMSFDYLPVRNPQCIIEKKGHIQPSKSEVRRWLENGSVIINGVRVKSSDEVKFPVNQLIFFYGSKEGPCTYCDDNRYYDNPELCRMREKATDLLIAAFDKVLARLRGVA